MEKQIRCMTCGLVISTRLEEYEIYRKELNLSKPDAADKAQLSKQCCRVTAFAQTGVEERVRAAGRVESIQNTKVVKEIQDYPSRNRSRKPGVGGKRTLIPAKFSDKEIVYGTYTGPGKNISKVPLPSVFTFHNIDAMLPATPKGVGEGFHRLENMINTMFRYVNKVWSLAEVYTFPYPQHLNAIFTSSDIKVAIEVSPFIPYKIFVDVPKGTKVVDGLEMLKAAIMISRSDLLHIVLKSPHFRATPHIYRIALKNARGGQSISAFEVANGNFVVSKIAYDRDKKVHTFSFERERVKMTAKDGETRRRIMSAIGSSHISEVSTSDGKTTMVAGKAIMTFNDFTWETSSKEALVIPLGGEVLGVESSPRELLMTVDHEGSVAVLVIRNSFHLEVKA